MLTVGVLVWVLYTGSLAAVSFNGWFAAVDSVGEERFFALVNEARNENDRSPLARDERLDRIAREKARDMAVNGYVDHVSPTLGTVFDMLEDAGLPYKWAGENIGRGASVAAVHTGLMESPGHRANILSAGYTQIGIGVVTYGRKVYVAQVFRKPRQPEFARD